jgi:hypothetical protein
MKSIFEKASREELIVRISNIDNKSIALWGKMNLYQMMRHCILWDEMCQGKTKYKRTLIGFFIGKRVLHDFIKDENPFPKNVPGLSVLKVKETEGNLVATKIQWITSIENYSNLTDLNIVHPFFGKMTKEQVGLLAYKHIDHHLRQFNG